MRSDAFWIESARNASVLSNDPSTKTGAVIVAGDLLIGTGYNHHPAGIEEPDFLDNRELKLKTIIHCEDWAVWNAIACGWNPQGATLYTWPFMSCALCATKMVRAGIIRAVAPFSDNPRWQADFDLTKRIFAKAAVELVLV